MNSNNVYIYDAVRTPRGKGMPAREDKPGGSLCTTAPHELVVGLIEALQERTQFSGEQIKGLTLGCVGQVNAQGGHIALVSRLASDLPHTVAVQSINNYCVSGLTAVGNAVATLGTQNDGLYLAGGVESLSHVGFLADKATLYTDPKLINKLQWAPPVMGAELVATLEGFSKAELDQITLVSHQRAAQAWDSGAFANCVVPITTQDGQVVLDRDELIRGKLTLADLEAMPPAFAEMGASGFDAMMLDAYPKLDHIEHVHSIANCPGMADGAALVLLGNERAGLDAGLKPRARVIAHAEAAGDAILQFGAGFSAMHKVLDASGLAISDFDRIEFMEAFAAIPLKFLRDYNADSSKVNVNGGHLAMGHPMGATGAILLTQLVHELGRCDGRYGLVVASAGGGLGSAMVIERV